MAVTILHILYELIHLILTSHVLLTPFYKREHGNIKSEVCHLEIHTRKWHSWDFSPGNFFLDLMLTNTCCADTLSSVTHITAIYNSIFICRIIWSLSFLQDFKFHEGGIISFPSLPLVLELITSIALSGPCMNNGGWMNKWKWFDMTYHDWAWPWE